MRGTKAKRIGTGASKRPARRAATRQGLRLSQQPKFAKQRAPKHHSAIEPTWPRTMNQRAQGRPLILESPTSHMDKAIADNPDCFVGMPKHAIDALALSNPR